MRSQGLRAAAACGAVMLGGCGQIFDLTTVELPAMVDAAPPPDVPVDGAEEWGFSMPQKVVGLTDTDPVADGDPTLTSDMTEIYFKSYNRVGGLGLDDLWYSTRATASDAWAPPMRSTLASTEFDNQPRLAPDGLTIWFRRGGGSASRLMVSTRLTAKMDSLWSTPVQLTEFDATTAGGEDAGFLSTAPNVGYLMTKRVGAQVRIFRSAWQGTTWGTPTEVTELHGNGTYEQSPWVTPDQLTIVFDSNRDGCVGAGDLWLARRANPTDAFGAPICLREVSTSSYENAPWISPDLRHLYFRSAASGGGDIWEVHR